MHHADLGALVGTSVDERRAAPARRRPATSAASFEAQIAAFYPYPQSAPSAQARTTAPSDPRQRCAATSSIGALPPRRQSRRGED